MKTKTLIIVYGREGAGKSASVIEIYKKLSGKEPEMRNLHDMKPDWVEFPDGDKIGFASEGDPRSRQKSDIQSLIDAGCNIIICACRANIIINSTKAVQTVKNIYELAEANGYETIWTHHYELRSTVSHHTTDALNAAFAEAIIDLIHRL